MSRPTVDRIKPYVWMDGDKATPGYILTNQKGLRAVHLTTEEALHLAHQIADTLQAAKDFSKYKGA